MLLKPRRPSHVAGLSLSREILKFPSKPCSLQASHGDGWRRLPWRQVQGQGLGMGRPGFSFPLALWTRSVPVAHAQWRRGEVAAKPRLWGFRPGPLGTELGLARPGGSRLLPERIAVKLSPPCNSGSSLPRRRRPRRRHCCPCCVDGAERQVLMSPRVSTGRPGRGEAGKGRRLEARPEHLLGA